LGRIIAVSAAIVVVLGIAGGVVATTVANQEAARQQQIADDEAAAKKAAADKAIADAAAEEKRVHDSAVATQAAIDEQAHVSAAAAAKAFNPSVGEGEGPAAVAPTWWMSLDDVFSCASTSCVISFTAHNELPFQDNVSGPFCALANGTAYAAKTPSPLVLDMSPQASYKERVDFTGLIPPGSVITKFYLSSRDNECFEGDSSFVAVMNTSMKVAS
jgi:hypothetical protein